MSNYLMQRVFVRKFLDDNTWETFANGIVIDTARDVKVSTGVGKKKDSFDFRVPNPNNHLFSQVFSGDGNTTDFSLRWYPIPTSFLDDERFQVFVDDGLKLYTTDYTLSLNGTTGATVHFGTAPGVGHRNVEVRFACINVNDMVRVYFWQNAEWGGLSTAQKTAALEMEGTVSEPSSTINEGSRELVIRGAGLIEVVFSGLTFLKRRTDSGGVITADVVAAAGSDGTGALQRVVSQLNQYNKNRNLVWASDNVVTTKEIFYSSTYKPAIEVFEELSGDDYSGKGQLIYWVDYNSVDDTYEIHLKEKGTAIVGTITEGTEQQNIKVKKATDDVINMLIYNCGTDPAGHAMEFPNFRFTTGLPAKWKYISSTNYLGEQLLNDEFINDAGEWDTTTDGARTSNYPVDYDNDWLDADGDWDFTFEGRSDAGVASGTYASCTTQKGFIDAIRKEARWRGKEATDRLLDLFERPVVKCVWTFPSYTTNAFVLGDLWYINLASFGLYDKKLRIVQIDYSLKDTTLYFEEDETVIEVK